MANILKFTQPHLKAISETVIENFGDRLCDMHYGLPSIATNHISIECDCAYKMFEVLVGSVTDTEPRMISNKLAVLVGVNLHPYALQFAYQYDGRRFGIFEVLLE